MATIYEQPDMRSAFIMKRLFSSQVCAELIGPLVEEWRAERDRRLALSQPYVTARGSERGVALHRNEAPFSERGGVTSGPFLRPVLLLSAQLSRQYAY